MCDKDWDGAVDPNEKIGWFHCKDLESKLLTFIKSEILVGEYSDWIPVIGIERTDGGIWGRGPIGINVVARIHSKLYESSDSDIYRKHMFENYYVFTFRLQQMEGCCGVLVSSNTTVKDIFQGKGVASFLQGIKYELAQENEYSRLICTVVSTNEIEKHILGKHCWIKQGYDFVNHRTGNTIETWAKTVNLLEK